MPGKAALLLLIWAMVFSKRTITKYHTSVIIFFTPIFDVVYNQERVILQTIHVLYKEILQFLGSEICNLWLRAVSNQKRIIMASILCSTRLKIGMPVRSTMVLLKLRRPTAWVKKMNSSWSPSATTTCLALFDTSCTGVPVHVSHTSKQEKTLVMSDMP